MAKYEAWIVMANSRVQVGTRTLFVFEDFPGFQKLKNIYKPLRTYGNPDTNNT